MAEMHVLIPMRMEVPSEAADGAVPHTLGTHHHHHHPRALMQKCREGAAGSSKCSGHRLQLGTVAHKNLLLFSC